MSFITDTQLDVDQCLEAYHRCEAHEQALLRVLSVFGGRMNPTRLKAILAQINRIDGYFRHHNISLTYDHEVMFELMDHQLLTTTQYGLVVPKTLYHTLAKQCVTEGSYDEIFDAINHVMPFKMPEKASRDYHNQLQDRNRAVRHYCFMGLAEEIEHLFNFDINPQVITHHQCDYIVELTFYPFDQAYFLTLTPMMQYQAFAIVFERLRVRAQSTSQITNLLQSLFDNQLLNNNLKTLLGEQYVIMTEYNKANVILASTQQTGWTQALLGWLAFVNKDMTRAIDSYQQAIKVKNKVTRRKYQHVGGLPGLFYLLAILKHSYNTDMTGLVDLLDECSNTQAMRDYAKNQLQAYHILNNYTQILRNLDRELSPLADYWLSGSGTEHHLAVVFSSLCFTWSRKALPPSYHQALQNCFKLAATSDQVWLAQVTAQLLCRFDIANKEAVEYLHQYPVLTIDLLTLIEQKSRWQESLDKLIALKRPTANESQSPQRLIWWIQIHRHPYILSAATQIRGKKDWLKANPTQLKQLANERDTLSYLTREDELLCQLIKTQRCLVSGSYTDIYTLSGYEALKAAIGHPNLFIQSDIEQPIEIVETTPELLVIQAPDGYQILMPGFASLVKSLGEYPNDNYPDLNFTLNHHVKSSYQLTNYLGLHLQIADIVGVKGLNVPKEAKDQVLQSIRAIAPYLNIQSDMPQIAQADIGIKKVEPNQTLYINIQLESHCIEFNIQMQPLDKHGPTFKPGIGNTMVVAMIDGTRTVTHRNLKQEKKQLSKLVKACSKFACITDHCLILNDFEEGLHCLEQLHLIQNLQSDPIVVLQWPKGGVIELSKPITASQVNLSINQHNDWFSLEGQLIVTEDEVVDLKRVLAALEQNNSRFIPLADNTYLALTEQLRQQLTKIISLSEKARFHALAAPAIEQAFEDMTVKSDQSWKQMRVKLNESAALQPQLPATLQAQLRDYQLAGFDWAYRLAHWSTGACLADDMGLGKTLQSLALILSRASQGPTLVLAPTSVCFNWLDEIERFAPTLNATLLGNYSKNQRHLILTQPQPYDLIICSYGLLQTEGELLSKIDWHTLIADEAQALKNPAAKRTRVANSLNARFKLITTGTPVENNLTELWSLFNFCNPGLLGTKAAFKKRFISNIEGFEPQAPLRIQTNQALRQRISPFILRRLKSEVLTELPPRTEINLHVELSPQEMTLYESMRQRAVEKLTVTEEKTGQQHIRILAEIMKLRRACCHPSLVTGGESLVGSKLNVFDNLVDELRQGGHRALVFSQFVGHLAILRQHLLAKKIDFQYLDGSTPPHKRKQAVDAFQAGDGELFLISLKAGGAGLNLTAADYVIHMDPWWNPAVEDQASDRAHRMGQTRPVTIYRLICQDTIEDKIVALHQQKRELANSLLEDSDTPADISVENMMLLLQAQ